MNILQITNKVPYPPKDGGAIAILSLSRGFAEQGHSVTVLALNTNKHYFNIQDIPKEITDQVTFIGVDINTDVKPTAALKNLLFSKEPYNAERFISHEFKSKITEVLSSKEFDVIQLEGLYLMPYVEHIKSISKVPVSLRAHNIEHEIWEQTLKQETGLKKVYVKNLTNRLRRFELNFINNYDFLVPITQRDADKFTDFNNTKPIHVSPTGLNAEKYLPKQKQTSNHKFFHIGAMDWTPNQEGLLWFLENVWKQVSLKHPDAEFAIAGRNAPQWFEEKILQYKVNYLGEVDNALDFMHDNSTMIVPLLSGSGMRIKIIEGLAAGKVIISTNKGAEGIPAIHRKEILLSDSPEDFIRNIELILSDKKLFSEISVNASEFIVRKFDNFAISKALSEFYQKEIMHKQTNS